MGQSVAVEEERDNPSASSKVVLLTMFKCVMSQSVSFFFFFFFFLRCKIRFFLGSHTSLHSFSLISSFLWPAYLLHFFSFLFSFFSFPLNTTQTFLSYSLILSHGIHPKSTSPPSFFRQDHRKIVVNL